MATILDQYGKPIERQVLVEPQTSQLAWLHRHFAGHPGRGLTPERLSRILVDAERGNLMDQSELFEDMEERDAHIYSEMSKRRSAILTLEWEIVAPDNADAKEKRAAEVLRELVLGIPNFEDLLVNMMDAVGKGFAPIEIQWGMLGKSMLPTKAELQPQSWFMMDKETRRQLRLRNNTAEGAALQPFGWIVHEHKAKSGYLARSALYRVLAWPYLFKNYSVRDLAEFLEIYGLPMRIGKYPSGSTDDEKRALMRAVVGIGHNAAGIMPAGMEIEFENAAQGDGATFKTMIDFCEASESKAILGGTLTSQAGPVGSQALGTVHREVQLDIQKADARQVGSTLTRDLLYPLHALNIGPIDLHRCPRFVIDVPDPVDIAMFSTHYPRLAAAGVRIPISHLRRRLRIPEPVGDEPVMAGPSAEPSKGPSKKIPIDQDDTEREAARTAPAGRDHLDDLVDEALGEWEAAISPTEAAIDAAIDGSVTLEELRAKLSGLAATMDLRPFTERIARAMFSSRLAGEADLSLTNDGAA